MNYSLSRGSYDFFISEKFSEMIIKTERSFIRDDNDFKFGFYKGISKFKFALLLNSISFADDKLGGLNRASSSEVLLGGKVYPFAKFGISALAGYKIDYQMGQRDHGWAYMISTDTSGFTASDYHMIANFQHSEDFITPRKNSHTALNLTLTREFTSDVKSKVEFSARRVKRDFYFYADSNLQRMYGVNFNVEGRDEKAILGQMLLVYPLFENLMLKLNFSASGRNILKLIRYKTSSLYDSNIEEFILNTGVGLSYSSEKFRASFGVNYVERNETHVPKEHSLISETAFFRIKQSEEQKNNKSLRRGINGEVSLDVSENVTLGGMFYLLLFRYDTPSSLNDDDRDELLQIMRIFFKVKLSREIELEVPLDLNSQHFVYIFSTRSVNNNWNRIIKLSPSVIFESGEVRNKSSFFVLANYTIYDFEEHVSSVKSYVFRQFYLNDSLSFPVFDNVSFDGSAQLILSESGRLKWKEFKESPTIFINTLEYNFKLNYIPVRSARFSIGYHFFNEKRFKFAGLNKVPDSRIIASGPTCGVEFTSEKFNISCSGWLEWLRFGDKVSRIPNLNLNLTFNL